MILGGIRAAGWNGEQLRLAGTSAAAVMAHVVEQVADRQIAVRRVRLVQHPVLAAPLFQWPAGSVAPSVNLCWPA